jgi:hypothetical protein
MRALRHHFRVQSTRCTVKDPPSMVSPERVLSCQIERPQLAIADVQPPKDRWLKAAPTQRMTFGSQVTCGHPISVRIRSDLESDLVTTRPQQNRLKQSNPWLEFSPVQSLRALCKPEVTGSIPVRSTHENGLWPSVPPTSPSPYRDRPLELGWQADGAAQY